MSDNNQLAQFQAQMATRETSAAMVAEQAKAAVQARYQMAMYRRRNMDDVRQDALKECKRSSFAATAMYAKPVGGTRIVGLSIRFAEMAMRALGNLLPETYVVYDDEEKRIIRVMLTDLEANVTFSKDVVVNKTVERRDPKGYQVISQRTNKQGKQVFICAATDDDITNKQNSLESKVLRNHVLRLLPGDLIDECKDQIAQTNNDQSKKDPDGGKKKLADRFARKGVKPSDLAQYLGHQIDRLSQAEADDLREILNALESGEASWDDFVRQAAEQSAESDKDSSTEKTEQLAKAVQEKLGGKKNVGRSLGMLIHHAKAKWGDTVVLKQLQLLQAVDYAAMEDVDQQELCALYESFDKEYPQQPLLTARMMQRIGLDEEAYQVWCVAWQEAEGER